MKLSKNEIEMWSRLIKRLRLEVTACSGSSLRFVLDGARDADVSVSQFQIQAIRRLYRDGAFADYNSFNDLQPTQELIRHYKGEPIGEPIGFNIKLHDDKERFNRIIDRYVSNLKHADLDYRPVFELIFKNRVIIVRDLEQSKDYPMHKVNIGSRPDILLLKFFEQGIDSFNVDDAIGPENKIASGFDNLVNGISFKGKLRKIFFQASNSSLKIRKEIDIEELRQLGITPDEIRTELKKLKAKGRLKLYKTV